MIWSARHLKIISGVVTVAVLAGFAAGYLCSRWALNDRKFNELKQAYVEINRLNEGKPSASVSAAAAPQESGQKSGATLNLTFRAISHNDVSPTANADTVFEVLNGIKGSDYFDASKTKPAGEISAEVSPGTFSFKIVTQLKRPLTL